MTTQPITIGRSSWTRDQMVNELGAFLEVYKNRPIKNNSGGMQSPHLFLMWFMLKQLKPSTVVESGIWQGQGTWFIENACPDASIICMDPDHSRLKYRSGSATYTTTDFSKYDFSGVDLATTVVFVDDHQNALERIRQASRRGFRHMIFEDNYYPGNISDCYSLKLVLSEEGWRPEGGLKNHIKRLAGLLPKGVKPNCEDAQELRSLIEVYEEQPPVYLPDKTRWGTAWPPTPAALLTGDEPDWEVYREEADSYTWMAYVRLKELHLNA